MSTPHAIDRLAPDVRDVDEILARLSSMVINPAPVDSRLFAGVGLGDIDILRCDIGPSTIELRQRWRHGHWVLLGRSEGAALNITTADGKQVRAETGEAFLLQLSHAYRIRTEGSGRLTMVVLPANVLCELPDFVNTVSRRVVVGGMLSTPTWSFLDSLVDQPLPWAPLAAYYAESLITEMLTSIVLTVDTANSRTPSERSLLRRARTHIAAFARDPRLSTQTIADSLGISVRSLQRVFANAGESLSAEMRRARVKAAITLLRSAEAEFMTLDEIAQNVGYVDAVAMRRSFHAAGADQPRNYRSKNPRHGMHREDSL